MRPTKYNKRITVQKPSHSENDIGGWVNDYNNLLWSFTCWASVVPVKGYKRIEYAKIELTEVYEVEMRKRLVNVDSDCRVTYGGNEFQITSLIIDDEKVNMDIGR